ncbi:hypothetical protein FS837_000937 [Tulasnella sp. UAMH 9824]|nr:hypothetical protein FS837_000937 [Tulasnella sp. UAMH 9824]
MGHCFYGEDCNFSHSTPRQSTNASTPAVNPLKPLGPSPPQLIHKAHSTHHSPAISPLNAPAIRNLILGDTVPSATLSAPTRPRKLSPPVSHGAVNWSLPAVGTPGTPSMGLNTPISADSPIITSGATEWTHPPVSPSDSLQPNQLGDSATANGVGSAPAAGRSPFLLTFGEIGPSGVPTSATNSPRDLGFNGASLAGASTASLRIGSPMLGDALALGITAIVARQRSRLSTSADAGDEGEGGKDADAETEEPDFPSISYRDSNDVVTEPDDSGAHPPPPERSSFLEFGSGPSWSSAPGEYAGPNGYGGHANGSAGTNGINGYGTYEDDWGHALNMLQTPHHPTGAPPPYLQQQQQNGHYGNGNGNSGPFRGGYKSRPCKFYVAGSRCLNGQNCTFIHDPEALRRPAPNGTGGGALSPPPKLGSDKHPLYRTRECKYHLAGRCRREEGCDFKHTGPPGQGREYENWEGFGIKVREHDIPAEDRGAFQSERTAINMTRNKHKMYSILRRSRDICNYILDALDTLADSVEGQFQSEIVLEDMEKTYRLINAMEEKLLELVILMPIELETFGPTTLSSWSQSQAALIKFWDDLSRKPFDIIPDHEDVLFTDSSHFDDCSWFSRLLHEIIEPEIARQFKEDKEPPSNVISLMQGFMVLENAVKCRSLAASQDIAIDMATMLARTLARTTSLGKEEVEPRNNNTPKLGDENGNWLLDALADTFSASDRDDTLPTTEATDILLKWSSVRHDTALIQKFEALQ